MLLDLLYLAEVLHVEQSYATTCSIKAAPPTAEALPAVLPQTTKIDHSCPTNVEGHVLQTSTEQVQQLETRFSVLFLTVPVVHIGCFWWPFLTHQNQEAWECLRLSSEPQPWQQQSVPSAVLRARPGFSAQSHDKIPFQEHTLDTSRWTAEPERSSAQKKTFSTYAVCSSCILVVYISFHMSRDVKGFHLNFLYDPIWSIWSYMTSIFFKQ